MANARSWKAKEKRVPRDARSRTGPFLAPSLFPRWDISFHLKEALLLGKGKQLAPTLSSPASRLPDTQFLLPASLRASLLASVGRENQPAGSRSGCYSIFSAQLPRAVSAAAPPPSLPPPPPPWQPPPPLPLKQGLPLEAAAVVSTGP